jgi:hypothetical protein
MSRMDELTAVVADRQATALAVGEALARQHDWVASLRTRLTQAEAVLRDLVAESEEAEVAYREACRDVELEADQVEDGAYGDDMYVPLGDDPDGFRDATPEEAEEIAYGIFGPMTRRNANAALWA